MRSATLTGMAIATDDDRRLGTTTRGTAGTTTTRGTGAAPTTTAGIRPGTMAGMTPGTMAATAGTEAMAGIPGPGMEAVLTSRVLLHAALPITQAARSVSVRDRVPRRRAAPSGRVHSRPVSAVLVRRSAEAAVLAAVARSAAVVVAVVVLPAAVVRTAAEGRVFAAFGLNIK